MNVQKNIWYGVKQHGEAAQEMYEKLLGLLKIEHLRGRGASVSSPAAKSGEWRWPGR